LINSLGIAYWHSAQTAIACSVVTTSQGDLREALLTSWTRHMRARNLYNKTVAIYLTAAQRLTA
jgi:hypothetical protein